MLWKKKAYMYDLPLLCSWWWGKMEMNKKKPHTYQCASYVDGIALILVEMFDLFENPSVAYWIYLADGVLVVAPSF